MELSPEDELRINVLLARSPQAIRIDEGSMRLYALTDSGEAQVQLSPNCRDERYLKNVREMLAGHVLNSPGGYPVFLRRWTRMGQAAARPADLLLLGEPEAVVAVVHSPDLTPELARRAWWALPTADTARRMLDVDAVAASPLGPELAAFLVEFLPFEEDPANIVESVRLVLLPGLISDQTRARLWKMGARKNVYRVGFLHTLSRQLPDPVPARQDLESFRQPLSRLGQQGNPLAELLQELLDSQGQTFLHVAEQILRKPATQEVVNSLMNALGAFFRGALMEREPGGRDLQLLIDQSHALCNGQTPSAVQEILDACPQLGAETAAMLTLALINEEIVTPVFARSTAVGSVMRKHLEPVSSPLLKQLAVLQGKHGH